MRFKKIECYIHNIKITAYLFQEGINQVSWKNLNEKKILYNKRYCKSVSGDNINLTEYDEHVKTDVKTVEVLNSFFSNTVKNRKIPQYSNFDHIFQIIQL